jgi:hypothetical protein
MRLRTVVTLLFVLCWASAAIPDFWIQSDWQGGDGQQVWSDTSKYYTAWSEDGVSASGHLKLRLPGWEYKEVLGATHANCLVQTRDGAIYVGAYNNADIFRSTDDGETWLNIGSIPDMQCPWDIIETPDSTLYANRLDRIYQSKDGSTWIPTGELPPGVGATYGLLAYDTTIYVSASAGSGWGQLYKSTDRGISWVSVSGIPYVYHPYTLFKDGAGAVWTGGNGPGYVSWTTDHGFTWDSREDVGWAYDFSQISEDTVYFCTHYPGGHVWRVINRGIWEDLGELPALEFARCVLTASHRSIYVGGYSWWDSTSCIYRSADGGSSWQKTGDIANDQFAGVTDLIETTGGAVLAAGSSDEGGCVFKLSVPRGWVVSSVYDAEGWPVYGTVSYSYFPDSGSVAVKIRTDTSPDMSGAPDWDLCPVATNGQDISELSSVDDGERYIQYRVDMVGWEHDFFRTPVFNEISIEYTRTGVEQESDRAQEPVDFRLFQNEPNPFHSSTVIRYLLPKACAVNLSVYDVSGRLAETLVDAHQETGFYEARWDGGRSTSGIYFCRLVVGDLMLVSKMILLR